MAFVLTISERNNSWAGRAPVSSIHGTRSEAETALGEYVRRNWDSEMDGESLPDNEAEMVQEYFAEVLESYVIAELSA